MKFAPKFSVGARIALAALALFLMTSLSHVAGATVLVNQPATFPTSGCSPACWTSSLDSTASGFITWEDFSLGSTSAVTTVQWQGLYDNSNGTATTPDTNQWGFFVYTSAAGAPANVVASDTLLASSVTATSAGSDTVDLNCATTSTGDCPVFNFSANVTGGTGFSSLSAGNYWIAIVSYQSSFLPIFSWTSGTGGDGISYQCQYTSGVASNCGQVTGDRALTITGTAVTSATPEPSSLVLFGSGLFGLAGVIRRKLRR